MKIAYLITRADDVGGAQVHVRDMSEAFRLLGHDVTVIAGGSGRFSAELRSRGIPHRALRSLATPIRPAKDFLALLEIVKALREIKPDIVAAHTAKAGLLGRIASSVLSYPVVFTPHGWSIADRISARKGRFFRTIESLASMLSSRIINVCDFEVELARKSGVASRDKLVRVYNGLPDSDDDLRADPSIDPPRIVMIARMAPPKDHAILIAALSRLKHLRWILELAGDGPLEAALRKQVSEAGLGDRVRFLGFREDSAELLRSAQIFALTSRSEAFPYSILEAMRAALPVVATAVGGVPEAVVDGETGLLAPSGDATALERHLARLIGDPALRRQLGGSGRDRFLAHFTFDKMFYRTLRVYEEAIVGRSATPDWKPSRALQARPAEGPSNR
jgi:glycosyltransferase involved in cell wall biosynthesis